MQCLARVDGFLIYTISVLLLSNKMKNLLKSALEVCMRRLFHQDSRQESCYHPLPRTFFSSPVLRDASYLAG
jgi:hypothetical protein